MVVKAIIEKMKQNANMSSSDLIKHIQDSKPEFSSQDLAEMKELLKAYQSAKTDNN